MKSFARAAALWRLYLADKDDLPCMADEFKAVFSTGPAVREKGVKLPAAVLAAEVKRLNLARPGWFDAVSGEELDAIYNGFGPDAWPATLRDAATWWYRNFQPAALIHDAEYDHSDGTMTGWKAADGRFARNTSAILADRYPVWKVWLWPARVAAWSKKELADKLLAMIGWTAYAAAYERRRK